jgi:hypothetical protein
MKQSALCGKNNKVEEERKMKRAIFWTFAVLAIFSLAACEEETSEENAYGFGLYDLETNSLTVHAALENYLKNELALPWGVKVYTGKDKAETDDQAKKVFNAAKVKINKSRLDTITGSDSLSFKYEVYAGSADGSSDTPLASYSYSKP